jgi:hypothetical protein
MLGAHLVECLQDIARARTIPGTLNPERLDVHTGVNAAEPADRRVHAGA